MKGEGWRRGSEEKEGMGVVKGKGRVISHIRVLPP